jgi:uncharacterized membrane protein
MSPSGNEGIHELGDPSSIPEGSWRTVEINRDNIIRKLIWHIALFVLYLITIALVFIAVILEKTPDCVVALSVKIWIDRAYMFFGVSAFLLSFALPSILLKMQMDRIDAESARRRAQAGIVDT